MNIFSIILSYYQFYQFFALFLSRIFNYVMHHKYLFFIVLDFTIFWQLNGGV